MGDNLRSSPTSAQRSRALRHLEATVALALLVPAILFAFEARQRYIESFDQARKRLDSDAQVAAQHALRVFDTTDLLLQRTFELIGDSDDASLREREQEIYGQLSRMTGPLTHVQSMWIFDRHGRPIGSNKFYPVPDFSVKDREYFQWHRKGLGNTYVTEALVARVGGERFFDVSRRRIDSKGNFDGLISVGLRPQHFSSFYENLAGNRNNVRVAIYRDDGRFVASWPSVDALDAPLLPRHPLLERWAAGQTTGGIDEDAARDGSERIGAFRKIEQYPLYIYVSMPRDAVLVIWQREIAVLAAFALPGSLLLAWMAWLARNRTRDQLRASQRLMEESEQRQRAEASLLQAQKLEAIGHLTGGVAHDFNNLLAVMENNISLLEVGDLAAEKRASALARMKRAVESGVALTRQLLSFTRHQPLRPEVVSLQQRLPTMTDMLRTALGSQIQYELSVATDTALVEVDGAELELALLNLVVNAKDACRNGGRVAISARNSAAEEWTGHTGPGVLLEVADSGEGFEPALLKRAFEPFFTTKPVGKGTGLGLSQVYGFCRRAHGNARIDSKPGNGTKVQLWLPASQHTAAQPALPVDGRLTSLRCSVLLVDDNEMVAQSIGPVLEATGCTVEIAGSAEQALAILERGTLFDAVLSDVVMPGAMDGIGLAEAVKSAYPELPTILMTGYSDKVDSARSRGFIVLPKPCSTQALIETLTQALCRPAGSS